MVTIMFELIMELNKMCARYNNAVTIAIRNTLLEEKNIEVKKGMTEVLSNINNIVRILDDIVPDIVKGDVDSWFTNRYLETICSYYFVLSGESFIKKYSSNYWNEIHKLILEKWKKSAFDVKKNDDIFIKIFDEALGSSLRTHPDICERKLNEFVNIYRATQYDVDDAYQYIMPDPKYCKNNRWNDDGVAYLYLAYDAENMIYRGINMAEKTCFEECRLKENRSVAICQFRPKKTDARIMYLAYQDIDYDKMFLEFDQRIRSHTEELLNLIDKNEKLKNKLTQYVQRGRKDLFQKKLKQFMDKIGVNASTKDYIQKELLITLLGNICDSVFYAVDKSDDPELEAYVPFRKFSKYLIHLGYDGVAYRSTRMELIGLKGTNLVLFNPDDAEPVKGTMKVYKYHNDRECELIKEY